MKCDEAKPVCARCRRYPELCDYGLKLSWTQGRPFKKRKTSANLYGVFDLTSSDSSEAQPACSDGEAPHPVELENDQAVSFIPGLCDLDQDQVHDKDCVVNDLSSGDLSSTTPQPRLETVSIEQLVIAQNLVENDIEEIVNTNHFADRSTLIQFSSRKPSEYLRVAGLLLLLR